MSFFKVTDIFATALPLGHAISRLGCLFAGCCYGKPTALPWGVVYTDPLAPGPKDVPLHPTQLYEVGYLTLIFVVVNWLYPRRRFDGQVALAYLALYAFFRPLNEFLRDDATRGYFFEGVFGRTLTVSQGLSLVLAVAAPVVFIVVARVLAKRRTATMAETGKGAGSA
jgi:phosphatidylglycerol:prolipoprotein diacylglycerol transferase